MPQTPIRAVFSDILSLALVASAACGGQIRTAMIAIAEAELSWDIAAWLDGVLSPSERAAVERVAGLPPAAVAMAMAAELERRLAA